MQARIRATQRKHNWTAFSNPDMLHGPIFQSLVAFSIPIFLSMLFQNLYNTVDSFIVSRVLGETALAAVGAGGVILELLIGFANGAGMGMSFGIAKQYGAGNEEGVKKAAAASLVVGVLITLAITLVGLIFLENILHLLNTPKDIIDTAATYVRIIIANIFSCFFYNLFCGMLKAIGNSFIPLLYLIFASILNIVLDILFVAVFDRGVQGAAEATVIAQGVSALLSGIYIWKKVPLLVPGKRHFLTDFKLYWETTWTGICTGLMRAIVMIGTLTLQYGINSLGTLTIAAHTAARKVYSFGTMPVTTLSSSISMFASQNHGAKQYKRLRRALMSCYLFDTIYALFITVLFWYTAEPAIRFISGSENAVLLQNGIRYIRVVAPFYLVLGILGQCRFALQGLGKTLLPIVSSVIELIGKVLFTCLFVPKFGYSAVIFCEPIVWCCMAGQLLVSLYSQPEMRKEVVSSEE